MQALLDTISDKNRDGTLLREAIHEYLYASKSVDRLSSFEHEPTDDVRILNELFLVQGLDSEDLLCQHFQSLEDKEEGEGITMFEAFDAASYQRIAEVVFGPTQDKEHYWSNCFFDCVYDAIVTAVLNGVQRPPFGAVQKSTQAAEKDVEELVSNYFCYLGLREGVCDKELAGEFEDAFGGMYEILMAAIH